MARKTQPNLSKHVATVKKHVNRASEAAKFGSSKAKAKVNKMTKTNKKKKATNKSDQLKVYSNVGTQKRKSKKDLRARKKAEYLATLPKHPVKRLLYRLHPKRFFKYWLSKRGAFMALKLAGVGFALFALVVIGLVHGKLKSEEKEKVMKKFRDKEIGILVATTVIEVGVDVANASLIVIEGAERFGLAQLHQLRGRVGRGEHTSYCLLVPSQAQSLTKRLRAMETTSNGFKLAEMDMEIRGPGAIYGDRQHGMLDLRMADLSDHQLIKQARETAKLVVDTDPELIQYARLRERIEILRRITNLN